MKCQPWHLKTDHHDDCVRAVDGAGFVILPPCRVRISRVREIMVICFSKCWSGAAAGTYALEAVSRVDFLDSGEYLNVTRASSCSV